jgi:hypothetical protein
VNLKIDNHTLENIRIPVLWGDRAIIQESNNRLSVIDTDGLNPTLEVLRNQPAPGIGFIPTMFGFQVLRSPDVYEFKVRDRTFSTQTLGLPDVEIDEFYIRVGAEIYSNLRAIEPIVTLHVQSDHVDVGVPIPFPLFRLIEGRSKVA